MAEKSMVPGTAAIAAFAGLAFASACGTGTLALHAPECAPACARTTPTEIDMDPIETPASSAAVVAPVPMDRQAIADVLTGGMSSELHGRALQGEAAGYVARCTVNRFAIRTHSLATSSTSLTTMYVDLACTALRKQDRAPVWQGELRARTASRSAVIFAGDDGSLQSRTARMFGAAVRELASDLAVRALGLGASPSARVFRDEAAARIFSGIDDSPLGPAALAEKPDGVAPVLPDLKDPDSTTRASAWNVVAMAAGPGDPWDAGSSLSLDDDPFVRFFQYKALARLGSPGAMAQLRKALGDESEPQLRELLSDAIGSGGTGLARPPSTKASAPTNGKTTSP